MCYWDVYLVLMVSSAPSREHAVLMATSSAFSPLHVSRSLRPYMDSWTRITPVSVGHHRGRYSTTTTELTNQGRLQLPHKLTNTNCRDAHSLLCMLPKPKCHSCLTHSVFIEPNQGSLKETGVFSKSNLVVIILYSCLPLI